MMRRSLRVPPEHLYPVDDWRVVERRFSERFHARAETAMALSNGYIGIRGTLDEGGPATAPGTFVNGFHETWPIVHAEDAFGLARTGQTMINVPDATVIRLYVDDEPLFVPTAHLRQHRRVLDMREGVLERELEWSTPSGRHVSVRTCRLVSLEHRHLAAIEYEVVLNDAAAPVVLRSEVLDRQRAHTPPDRRRTRRRDDPRLATKLNHQVLGAEVVRDEGERILLGYRASNSGMSLGLGVHHVIESAAACDVTTEADGERSELVLSVDAQPGVPIRLVKYIAFHTSRREPASEVADRCRHTLDRAVREGYAGLRAAQRQQLDLFWDRADVQVDTGQPETRRTQQAVRWNLFQVAQATWRAEGSGVPAKGLTGQAYEGHYFWDTEIYVLPFLAYTQPRIARNLLRFRQSMLPKARERARELSHRGALFPWRTIAGYEASAYYQAGTAQYHLNADIAYAIRRYVEIRDDPGFLFESGAEVLVETARLWADLGFYADDGEFHIHGVTGPDEYTTVVNDNTYTNLLARMNLRYAAQAVRRMRAEDPSGYEGLVAECDLAEEEFDEWERAAEAMHVPYDERRGVNPQDANFLEREPWDLDATPPENFPLLLHYHPLVIYRHQVIKQADIVLAMFLLGDQFDHARKCANFDYYERLTSGDSSLSACVQSIVAAEVGREHEALEHFRFALLMDLADVAGNASDGVHIASAAGVWQSLVFGFGGVRDYNGRLSVAPRLPSVWRSLAFSLRFRNRQLRIELTHDSERYRLDEGEPLEIELHGEQRVLTAGEELVLVPAGAGGRAAEPGQPVQPV